MTRASRHRRALAFAAGALLVAALGGVALAQPSPTSLADYARSVRAILERPVNVALFADEVAISDRAVALLELSLTSKGIAAAEAHRMAISTAVKQALLAREADRRGFSVSDAEVETWILLQRQSMRLAPADVRQQQTDFLSGLTRTDDEYWADPALRSSVRVALMTAKLRTALIQQAGSAAAGEAALNDIAQTLEGRAQIRYVH